MDVRRNGRLTSLLCPYFEGGIGAARLDAARSQASETIAVATRILTFLDALEVHPRSLFTLSFCFVSYAIA